MPTTFSLINFNSQKSQYNNLNYIILKFNILNIFLYLKMLNDIYSKFLIDSKSNNGISTKGHLCIYIYIHLKNGKKMNIYILRL